MIDTAAAHSFISEHAKIHSSLAGGGHSWLNSLRHNALEHFAKNGFPTTKNEDWKYTHLGDVTKQTYQLSCKTKLSSKIQSLVAASFINTQVLSELDPYLIVFVNGHYIAQYSHLQNLPKDIVIASLATCLENKTDEIADYLKKFDESSQHGFSALNSAFLNDGAYIYIPANTVLKKPIQLLFFNTGSANPIASHVRNVIIAEENSEATIIESYIGANNESYLMNTVTQIFAKNCSRITHCKLQAESTQAFHVGLLDVKQHNQSQVNSHSFAFGGALVRSDSNMQLIETGANCSLNGLYWVNKNQHIDHHTFIDHQKPYTSSNQLYKGVLDAGSRAVFNGKITVKPDAQHINASQINNNLLLSDNAEIDTKPQLEIHADDVKCSHGATIGQLDEQALFYFRSRGIPLSSAQSLLLSAFGQSVIDQIGEPFLRSHLKNLLGSYLPCLTMMMEEA